MSTPALAPGAAADLVNAALLGTDRRPVPAPEGVDPATWLLEAAARRRAATLVGSGCAQVAPAPPAPAAVLPPPPDAARAILDDVLLSTGSGLVNLWLREALAAGNALAPEHWTPLLDRARRATDLDRARLGAALGPCGLWFARQNAAWAAVVRAIDAAGTPVDDTLSATETTQALDALADGTQQPGGARALGRLVGTRLPLDAYGALTRLAGTPLEEPARAGLAAAEEVLRVRWDLAHAFDPTREPPARRPFPPSPRHVPERRP